MDTAVHRTVDRARLGIEEDISQLQIHKYLNLTCISRKLLLKYQTYNKDVQNFQHSVQHT